MSLHMAMCIMAFVFACFACMSGAFRVQPSSEELQDSLFSERQDHSAAAQSFNAFAMLLRALSSSTAFNQVGAGARPVSRKFGAPRPVLMGGTAVLDEEVEEMGEALAEMDDEKMTLSEIRKQFESDEEPMNPQGMPLWLDLRGYEAQNDVDVLLQLYESMDKRFKRMRRPPVGRAVSGILKNLEDVDEEFAEGEMMGVAVNKTDGSLRSGDGLAVGRRIAASFEEYSSQREVVLASLQKQDEYLVLEGGMQEMLPLLSFALTSTKDQPPTSNSTLVVAQVQTHKDLKSLTEVKIERDADSSKSHMALLLRPDESLWFKALTGKKDILRLDGKSVKHGSAPAGTRGRSRDVRADGFR
mmetsp:Transcript_93092/g.164607  ORF Transcript_93092/g.164607 Transcript_93092/m.164607 type:complete len:357 (+) Transcript_93092:59-1129(+)